MTQILVDSAVTTSASQAVSHTLGQSPHSTTALVSSTTTSSHLSDATRSAVSSTLLQTSIVSASGQSGLFTTSQSPSGSDIKWGPAITASALPNAQTLGPGDEQQSASASGFSKGSRNLLIATTTVGGSIMLIFLIYALWRRRKGATVSEIVRFRPHSDTIILTPTFNRRDAPPKFPIYRENRFSIRSSKYASTASFPKDFKRPSGVPQPVVAKFFAQNPYIRDQWKSNEGAPAPPEKVRAARPPAPRMTEISYSMDHQYRHQHRATNDSSETAAKSGISISVNDTSDDKDDPGFESTHNSLDSTQNMLDRWSWTNSQAPATPRMYVPSPGLHSPDFHDGDRSGFPGFRTVKPWANVRREQVDEEMGLVITPETPSFARRKSSKLVKKNHRRDSSRKAVPPTNPKTPMSTPPKG